MQQLIAQAEYLIATCQTQQAPHQHQSIPYQSYVASSSIPYQSNPSTYQNNSTSHYPISSNFNPYPYQPTFQQPLSYATTPSSSHQNIRPQHQQQFQHQNISQQIIPQEG
jgi:hypothetical protein